MAAVLDALRSFWRRLAGTAFSEHAVVDSETTSAFLFHENDGRAVQLLIRYPQLRSEQAEAALCARLAELKGPDSIVALRRGRGRCALARACRELGMKGAIEAWVDDELPAHLDTFLWTTDLTEVRRQLEGHPGLLSDRTLTVLEKLDSERYPDNTRAWTRGRARLLERCQVEGIAATFAAIDSQGPLDPLIPLPYYLTKHFAQDPLGQLLVQIDEADDMEGLLAVIRTQSVAIRDPRLDSLITYRLLKLTNERSRLSLGMFRARIARCRDIGVEAALAEAWHPGMLPLDDSDLVGDSDHAFLLSVGEVTDLAELGRIVQIQPTLIEAMLRQEMQQSFLDPPTFCSPPIEQRSTYGLLLLLEHATKIPDLAFERASLAEKLIARLPDELRERGYFSCQPPDPPRQRLRRPGRSWRTVAHRSSGVRVSRRSRNCDQRLSVRARLHPATARPCPRHARAD